MLKLDTDTLEKPGGVFYQDEWFEGRPAIVAPRWGYTKPAHWLTTLDGWATRRFTNSLPQWELDGGIGRSRRIISYAMYGRTDFCRRILEYMGPDGRLPVPSQDTVTWYCAALWGEPVRRLRASEHAWRHCGGNLNKMNRMVAQQ
jgi:hypothetical protein